MKKYLIDTAIWIDLYEDRKGFNGEQLGHYAFALINKIISYGDKILITDLLVIELRAKYSLAQISSMIKPFEKHIIKLSTTKEQDIEGNMISKERNVPKDDALHAIIARDNNAILITRDNHFRKLEDINSHYKPEDII